MTVYDPLEVGGLIALGLLHRPLLLWLVVFASSMVLIFAMALTGVYPS